MYTFGLIIILIVAGVLLAFAFVILFGAPYLPTLSPQVKAALKLADLKPGQTLVELGSGDGRVVIAAAEQGIRVIGYELNPLLALYSWAKTRKYRGQIRIVWGNFWRTPLPDTDAIFTFLLPKYMEKLDTKITQDIHKPVKLISFAFKMPNRKIAAEEQGVFLYEYKYFAR